jgi:choline dehydrogenase-like flavoprotein
VRVLFEDSRATGVEFADATTGRLDVIPALAVVVAAGPLDTTELLMRSTSRDFAAGLGNAHGVLGRYLHDHPREWYALRLSRPVPALVHPMYVAREDHATSAPLFAVSSTLGQTGFRDRLRTFYGGSVDTVGVQAFGTTIPSPDHGVSFVDEATSSPTGSRLHIDLLYDTATVDNLRHGREHLRAALASTGVTATAVGPDDLLSPGSSVHFGGTARMHSDPQFGVVDSWNRVHDVPNVVVCDASCFTTGPEKNPTLTAMAIAARAADRLAKDVASTAS